MVRVSNNNRIYSLDTVAHGGVDIFIYKNFHPEEVKLNTDLQTVAIIIKYPIKRTICIKYLPLSLIVQLDCCSDRLLYRLI